MEIPVKLFGLAFLNVTREEADAIQPEVVELYPGPVVWHEWEFFPEHRALRAFGKIHLVYHEPGGELWEIAWLAWNAVGAYRPIILTLDPLERGERTFLADEAEISRYLAEHLEPAEEETRGDSDPAGKARRGKASQLDV